MNKEDFKYLKNGDVVQVFVNKKWVNGIVINNNRYGIYVHYFDGIEEYGNTTYFDEDLTREYDPNVINKDIVKKIKNLADKLIGVRK